MASLVALYCGIRFDSKQLAPGELAVVPLIAADRRQARIVMHDLRALCTLEDFHPYVNRIMRDGIELRTNVNVGVMTASFRTVRGYTAIACVLDEVAFWRDESTSQSIGPTPCPSLYRPTVWSIWCPGPHMRAMLGVSCDSVPAQRIIR